MKICVSHQCTKCLEAKFQKRALLHLTWTRRLKELGHKIESWQVSFMHIGLCSLFKSSWGGGETHVAQLSSALTQSGYKVTTFYGFSKHPNSQNSSSLFRAIFQLGRKPLSEDVFYDSELAYHALRIHRFALKQKIDLLHFHYVNFVPATIILRRLDRIPVIVTLHWCPFDYPHELAGKLWHSSIFPAHQSLAFTLGIRNASMVISPSKYYADLVEKRCGVRPSVIPNPISLEKYALLPHREMARRELNLDPSDFLILCVGRLDTEKGLKYLIQGFKSVILEQPHARLVIVGAGPLKSELMNLAKQSDIANVVFAGHVTSHHLNLLLSAADLYISPSLYENFSISILDALASGLPIICTNVGGSPEIVEDGTNGLLVPPRNSAAISEAIIRMMNNESARNLFRKNNRAKARLYSIDAILPKIINAYVELLSQQ